MALKIGIFSLKNNVGCTAMAIHMANYLAAGKNTIALIEPECVEEPEFNTAKADFEDDNTFVLNNVRYYPVDATKQPDENILIYDYGTVNFMFKFPDDIDQLYICVSNDETDIEDVIDFINETGSKFDVIIIGGTKNLLQLYSSKNLRSILVGEKKEKRIDRALADRLNFVLRKNKYNPPSYHADWEYAPTIFHYVPEDENDKKGFFSNIFGSNKKNKTNEPNEDITEVEMENKDTSDVIEESEIEVLQRKNVQEANIYEDFDFDIDSIPAPEVSDVIDENSFDANNNVESVESNTVDKKTLVDNKIDSSVVDTNNASKDGKKKNNNKTLNKKAEKEHEDEIAVKIKEKEKQEEKRKAAAKHRREVDAARIKEKEVNKKVKNKSMNDLFMKDKSESSEPLYRRRAAKGILGELIKEMADKEADISNIFIVTHSKKLFIFDSVELFYSKLGPLQREIKDPNEVHYMVLTFKDYDKEPFIMTKDDNLGDVYSTLASLDKELKRRVLDDDDIRNHKELTIFDEILYA